MQDDATIESTEVETAAAEGTAERTETHEAIVQAGGDTKLKAEDVKLTDLQKYFGCTITEMKGLTSDDKRELKEAYADLQNGGPGNYSKAS